MHSILILNGPNLNMLGLREPEIYGTQTLSDVESLCAQEARRHMFKIKFLQSNHEGALVEIIQEARGLYDGLIINAAAYTHTSVAIHDALKLLDFPIIEVHISNPKQREPFRHHSFIEPLAVKVFAGHGIEGYAMAIGELAKIIGAKTGSL